MRFGIYAYVDTPDSPLRCLRALVLGVGEPAVVSHETAAALLGLAGYALVEPFHVMIPRGRFLVRRGHIVHTTTDLDRGDRVEVEGFAVTSPARTLADLVRVDDPRRIRTALVAACSGPHGDAVPLIGEVHRLAARGHRGARSLSRWIG